MAITVLLDKCECHHTKERDKQIQAEWAKGLFVSIMSSSRDRALYMLVYYVLWDPRHFWATTPGDGLPRIRDAYGWLFLLEFRQHTEILLWAKTLHPNSSAMTDLCRHILPWHRLSQPPLPLERAMYPIAIFKASHPQHSRARHPCPRPQPHSLITGRSKPSSSTPPFQSLQHLMS